MADFPSGPGQAGGMRCCSGPGEKGRRGPRDQASGPAGASLREDVPSHRARAAPSSD